MDAEQRRRDVGRRITEIRTAAGLSLSALARAAGIGKGSLSELESGMRNPTLDTLYAVAGPLGVPLTALLGEDVGAEGAGEFLSAQLLHVAHHPDGGVTEVFWLVIRPGGISRSPGHGPGVVEHLRVVRGVLVAGVVGAEQTATQGESVEWISDSAHSYRSDDGAVAVLTIDSPA